MINFTQADLDWLSGIFGVGSDDDYVTPLLDGQQYIRQKANSVKTKANRVEDEWVGAIDGKNNCDFPDGGALDLLK